jgi:glycerol-3-phosphate dehydrogenase
MRWSKSFRRARRAESSPIEAAEKVVVFGGGSFGTAMGTSLALKKPSLDVVLLLRDPYLCHDINSKHINSKYLAVSGFGRGWGVWMSRGLERLRKGGGTAHSSQSLSTSTTLTDLRALHKHLNICTTAHTCLTNRRALLFVSTHPPTPPQDFTLPRNVRATTDASEAIAGASYAVHAVPVQHSRAFLSSIREVLPKDVPIICVSKGLEVGTGCMMSEVIPSALGRRQPAVFLSGPSFAKEVS